MDQSRAMAQALLAAGAPIAKLFSSPWVRCIQTLDPLVDGLGVQVVEAEQLGEVVNLPVHDGGDAWVTSAWLGGRGVALLDRIVAEHPGRRVVACSHGDVIPAVVALLVGRDGLDTTDVRCRKGGCFTLDFEGARCTAATYHEPPS